MGTWRFFHACDTVALVIVLAILDSAAVQRVIVHISFSLIELMQVKGQEADMDHLRGLSNKKVSFIDFNEQR